jgi:hypothetical protein
VLFVATSFLGSSLLFLIQPMVAKMLLPSLGGTPSVWNTSMVFFQAMLVAGYGLAHAGMRLLTPRRQRTLQVTALALPIAALPIALPGGWEPPVKGSPAGWLLLALTVMVGAPFLMLATSSPTLQHWFATGHATHGRDPYFLYAAGNTGSLLALLAYPVVIEPRFSLQAQARIFTAGYLALVVLSALCGLRQHRAAPPEPTAVAAGPTGGAAAVPGRADTTATVAVTASGPTTGTGPVATVTWFDRRRWIAWSFVPSALLLGVTRHLTTDVMSAPMLWIAPLTLYLLTFIIAFGRHPDRSVRIGSRGFKLVVIPLTLSFIGASTSLVLIVVLHLAAFFLAALLGHSRLAQSRPAPAHLTEFYLMISIGGALGGAVTALLAPLLFTTILEYPLAIVAALAMCPGLGRSLGWRRRPDARTITSTAAVGAVIGLVLVLRVDPSPDRLLVVGAILGAVGVVAFGSARTPRGFAAAMAVLLALAVLPATGTLVTDRSFFGVSRVQTDDRGRHVLVSGSTVHGLQDTDGDDPLRPLAYYHPAGPIGRYFTTDRPDAPVDAGVVGLGSGALAGYGRPDDHFTFYEIDPAVVRIAEDPRYFTYLTDTPADVDIALGDGRLTLARTTARHDILILDAFSSDSIPVHLLTREAFATYLDRITPDGLLAIHISNRYFDLEPVLTRTAADLGLSGVAQRLVPTQDQVADGAQDSLWVMLTPDERAHAATFAAPGARRLDPDDAGPAWTDSFSDVLGTLRL